MATYISKNNQTLADICLICYGTLDNLSKISSDNSWSFDKYIPAGTSFIYSNNIKTLPISPATNDGIYTQNPGIGITIAPFSAIEWTNSIIISSISSSSTELPISYQWQWSLDGINFYDFDSSTFPLSIDANLRSSIIGANLNTLTIDNVVRQLQSYSVRLKVIGSITGNSYYSNIEPLNVIRYHQWVENQHDLIYGHGLTWTNTQFSAFVTLINDLQGVSNTYPTSNIISKIKVLYPMLQNNYLCHSFNVVTPGSYQLAYHGSVNDLSNGIQFTGTGSYADTGWSPSLLSDHGSIHFSVYSQSNVDLPNAALVSALSSGTGHGDNIIERFSGTIFGQANSGGAVGVIADSLGTITSTRISSSVGETIYAKLLHSYEGSSVAETHFTTNTFRLGSSSDGISFSDATISTLSIGDGLTNSECESLHYAFQAYNTTLGRNV